MSLKINSEYKSFIEEIKERVRASQYAAFKAVNKELISLYWDIGKSLVEQQNKHGWGKSIVQTMAKDLQKEFPGIQGFSSQNLWRMKQFFQAYAKNTKLSPLVREIGWTHNIIILMNCKSDDAREFYIAMTQKFGWTKDVLIHQIENRSYEKTRNNQTSFDRTVPAKISQHAKLAVKDEYTFDFLELGDEHLENDLERALMSNVRRFLLEMGGYFCFVANQHRLEIDGREYFVDILLYHRQLRCLVAVELKIGDFKPEYAGKMQFYLSALNERNKLEGENPAIGIIICKSKSRTIVEYALKDVHKPIGVSTYSIKKSLPKMWKRYLPSSKDLAASVTVKKRDDLSSKGPNHGRE